MPRRLAAALVLLTLCVMHRPAHAACAPRTAEPTDIRSVAGDQRRFQGRCITVTGVGVGPHVYADLDALYEQSSDQFDPSANGAVLGLDGPLVNRIPQRYERVRLTGVMKDCGRPVQGAMFVFGYCHQYNGGVLELTHVVDLGPAGLTRRGQAFARPGYGDLTPAPANWPHLAAVHALVERLIATLRARDVQRLDQLMFGDPDAVDGTLLNRTNRMMLDDKRSPFAALRTAARPVQWVVLIGWNQAAEDDSAVVCFCRIRDCSQSWPIARRDANNQPERPYACAMAQEAMDAGRTPLTVLTPTLPHRGLNEPRQSAMPGR
jgi:hypothetical protein